MELKDRVALVTGGASGIGRATAKLFAEEGASVVIADLDHEAGRQLAREMRAEGHAARFVQGDVSAAQDAKRIVSKAIAVFGGVDVLFNSAGVIAVGSVVESRVKDLVHVIDVNLRGTLLVSKYAIPALIKRRGVILNIASGAGLLGVPNLASYSASKGGVILLTKSLAGECAPDVRVNCLCPGYVETPMHLKATRDAGTTAFDPAETIPLARVGQPEEVAAAALFLVSARASYITGACLPVDGGLTCTQSLRRT